MISSLFHELFRSMFLNYQTVDDFIKYLLGF